ncbi:MAG: Na+/H+ antiporter NhaC family protein [Pseudohongiellaceae bacterium]
MAQRAGIDELRDFPEGQGLLPVAMILLFALALGDVANLLGTGVYVAQVAQESIPVALMLPLLFLISAFIAFSIGSSWGTFAIMIPLAMQIALSLDLSTALFLAAVLSGSVFGDHASPISDTTVVSSMASATDHIDHARNPAALCADRCRSGYRTVRYHRGAVAVALFWRKRQTPGCYTWRLGSVEKQFRN